MHERALTRREVLEHRRTCDCPICACWRLVQEAITVGKPEERLAVWRELRELTIEIAPHVLRDGLRGVDE